MSRIDIAVVHAHQLTKRYSDVEVVRGIDFQIPSGKCIGLLGPNRAGKTTTLRMKMSGLPYLTFLASGVVASPAMYTASFEGMHSVYTRMVPQRTYDGMFATSLEVDDIIAGEILWCATKSVISGSTVLLVAAILGAVQTWEAVLVVPMVFRMSSSIITSP